MLEWDVPTHRGREVLRTDPAEQRRLVRQPSTKRTFRRERGSQGRFLQVPCYPFLTWVVERTRWSLEGCEATRDPAPTEPAKEDLREPPISAVTIVSQPRDLAIWDNWVNTDNRGVRGCPICPHWPRFAIARGASARASQEIGTRATRPRGCCRAGCRSGRR
jgi:hypothetical protein